MSATPASAGPGAPFPAEPWRVAVVAPEPPAGDLFFSCPRCGDPVAETAYGPCRACRAELRATLGGEARPEAHQDYVPKVNVTPNAVAVKD